MTDDVLTSKAATITRCVARAREEYDKDPSTFLLDPSRHDAAILNILRANAAALDMGHHLIRREKLGVPQSARDVFELLCRGGWLEASLLTTMKNMVGFSQHRRSRISDPATADHGGNHHAGPGRFRAFQLVCADAGRRLTAKNLNQARSAFSGTSSINDQSSAGSSCSRL